MKLLQINSAVNTCSHGRIAEETGMAAMAAGFRSYIAYGRNGQPSRSVLLKTIHWWDVGWHVLKTRLTDRHGFGSEAATRRLLARIIALDPDIIHLHNIHGYYLHVGLLFNFLKSSGTPVVWTLHDCWPFTGHCAIFEGADCYRWRDICYECPLTQVYPASWWTDRSILNFSEKKELFRGHPQLCLVTPSHWLERHLRVSFLDDYPVEVIPNGVDLDLFHPGEGLQVREKYGLGDRKIILGVASTWKKRRALGDFVELSRMVGKMATVLLVGADLPWKALRGSGILTLPRTESREELAELYSAADVFVNPTYADNFPTVNIEALACGTPVVTYRTGGCAEIVDNHTGVVVERGAIAELGRAVEKILETGKQPWSQACRQRAEAHFDRKKSAEAYIRLYRKMLALDEEGASSSPQIAEASCEITQSGSVTSSPLGNSTARRYIDRNAVHPWHRKPLRYMTCPPGRVPLRSLIHSSHASRRIPEGKLSHLSPRASLFNHSLPPRFRCWRLPTSTHIQG
jgi:glycosyltransferase involved in cell wall biosynthesis